MALVSIGIPTFNRAPLLRQAITCVLRQTLQNFEIIISDDCSTDDTAQVVASFHDPRIRYHRTATNLRPPRNWNECVRLAQGEIFALLPDDDAYLPDFLATMVHTLQANPTIGMAQCGWYSVDDAWRAVALMQASATPLTLQGEAAFIWEMERLHCVPVALLFRRTAMLELGLWREDYWDDWAFILRLAYRFGVTYIPDLLACNRTHRTNLNRRLTTEGRDAILDLINQQADAFREVLPLSPTLIALRATLQRESSEHAVLLALSALRRGDWGRAQLHWTRARHLYALAGLDPRFIGRWLALRADARVRRAQEHAAQSRAPLLQFAADK